MSVEQFLIRTTLCRACKGENLTRALSFGKTPPANAFLTKGELKTEELSFPLDVYFCNDCTLLQLCDIVSPELLFRDYVYVSSTSPAFVAHFESFAEAVKERFELREKDLVVDIGSNDGILLRPYKNRGIRVLGVDPAKKIAEEATRSGIPTLPLFFNADIARDIVREYGHARVITGTNVFAHINDLDSIVEGVKNVLTQDGVFVIEAPYAVDFLEKNLFDTVYHEHVSYFAIRPLQVLFRRLGMEIFDVEKVGTHGGSVRVFSQRLRGPEVVSDSVKRFLDLEHERRLGSLSVYEDFSKKIERNKKTLRELLIRLKKDGQRIAGYGAAAKANTLLNYFEIGPDILDYIVDDSSWKQGLYTPGMHIPVVAASKLIEKPVDYILILAWNFAEQIRAKLKDFEVSGGKFIVPAPYTSIL